MAHLQQIIWRKPAGRKMLVIEKETRTFYPDFSILSEIDYETVIYIEHQGKMSDPKYKDNSETREFDYWKNGILPNRDVYFTYDDNRGGLDIRPGDLLCDNSGSYKAKEYLGQDLRKAWDKRTGDDNFVCEK